MSAVYSSIISAGEGLDLGHVGTRVINTLRMEKGFRGWVDSDVNKCVFKKSKLLHNCYHTMFYNPKEICIRKHFKRWGHEMNKDTSPIETGLMPFVRYIMHYLNSMIQHLNKLASLEATLV